jgi:hypothetical protein
MTRRTPLLRLALVGAGLGLLLGACGTADDSVDGDDGSDIAPVPTGAVEASYVELTQLTATVEAAIADAAERYDVPAEAVAVAGALLVTWSDGALGCPREGGVYTQALVEGYLLTLEVDGRRIPYHGALGQPAFPCEPN